MPKATVTRIPGVNLGQAVVQQTKTTGLTAAAAPAARKLVFVAPYACTITAASICAYATIAASGTDYWSFKLEQLDGTDVTSALSTETVLTAGVPRSFTVTAAAATLAAAAPLYLYMADTGSPSDLDAADFIISIQYQPV